MAAANAPLRMRLSTEARRRLLWSGVLVASVHVLLLEGLSVARPSARSTAATAARSPAGATRPVTLTVVTPAPAPAGRDVPSIANVPEPARPASAVIASRSTDADSAGEVSAPAPAKSVASSPSKEPAASGAEFMAGDYLPRSLLSVPPLAKDAVIVPMPPDSAELGSRSGVLVVYIDEQGRVRHVEADPPALPPAMEQAAREAFMGAAFVPGQVDGHPVRSRIRIEVVFEATPLVPAIPASGASVVPPASTQPAP